MDGATAQKQSFAPNRNIRMKTPKKNGRGNFISNKPSENFDTYAGLLNPPPPPPPPPSRAMSFSYSHPLSASSLVYVQQQPPLLPLPHVVNKKKNRSREEAKKRSGTQSILSDNRWGPDPKDLPKLVLGMGNIHDDVVSGAVFNLAPPPTSLPLPNFSLRSKLCCKEETAAGCVDDRATNHLRRLLRLR